MTSYITKTEKETQKVAKDLAKKLRGGEIVLLYGDLGAGKTTFIKALAKALGVKDVVKSPTFNLMKLYKTDKCELCHIDAYRLESMDDLLDIGVDEYVGDADVISVIEWAERAKGIEKLGNNIIKIKIDHGKSDDERVIEIA